MNAESPAPSSELRAAARRLLRRLRSEDRATALEAAERFVRLRSFAGETPARVLDRRADVRLKHALAVIALEYGSESWLALKTAADRVEEPPMYVPRMETLLNRWFARYADARASLEEYAGYLLPYRNQFFICEREGIVALGLDPEDPDWKAIGYDWVRPADREAWSRLRGKRRASVRDGRSPEA